MSSSTSRAPRTWRRPVSAASPGYPPTYFLHINKCAGTSLVTMLSDAYDSAEILSPTRKMYRAEELDKGTSVGTLPPFSAGHFGQDLGAGRPEGELRTLTVLREPLDHWRSLHGYKQQHEFIDPDLSPEGWLERELEPRDCMAGHLIPGLISGEPRGVEEVSATLCERSAEALESLRECAVVGVVERMRETVSVLCDATGALPPRRPPHINDTLKPSGKPRIRRAAAERLLALERRLYSAALERLERDYELLCRRLEPRGDRLDDPNAITARLRRRWFADAATGGSAGEQPFRWRPTDPFPGEGLQVREHHEGRDLRWTGPDDVTTLYAEIDREQRWCLEVDLHPATPAEHIAGAGLAVNGAPFALEECETEGPLRSLAATINPPGPNGKSAPFSAIELRFPTARIEGDFRRLGLALTEIRLTPER